MQVSHFTPWCMVFILRMFILSHQRAKTAVKRCQELFGLEMVCEVFSMLPGTEELLNKWVTVVIIISGGVRFYIRMGEDLDNNKS